MKILIVTQYDQIIGGTEQYLRAVIPELRKQGIETRVWIEKPSNNPPDSLIDTIQEQNGLVKKKLPVWITQYKPDIILDQGIDSCVVKEMLFQIAPMVLFTHNHVGTCISSTRSHQRTEPHNCTYQFGSKCLIRYLPLGCGGRNPLTMWKLYNHQMGHRRLLGLYQFIITFSQAMVLEYQRHDIPLSKIVKLPFFAPGLHNLIEPDFTKPFRGRLLFLSRLTTIKGGQFLLHALRLLSQDRLRLLHLHIAGKGPEEELLKDYVVKYSLPVTFHGWVDHQNRQSIFEESDLLLVPSLWGETFGLVGIEAGSYGIPSVANDFGGISEWCQQGVTGELVPSTPATPRAFAAAITKVLDNPAYWQNLRINAWQYSQSLTVERHIKELLEVIRF